MNPGGNRARVLEELVERARQNAELAERPVIDGVYGASGADKSHIFIRITGGGGGNNDYDGVIQVPNGAGEMTDGLDTITGALHEVNDRHGIPPDTIVQALKSQIVGSTQHYVFDKDQGKKGTASTAVSYTHAEHADAANAGTWDRASQSTNRGVVVTVCTGMRYDDAGSEILYAYLRNMTFDADGHLTNVGAETRVTIDAPEDCT